MYVSGLAVDQRDAPFKVGTLFRASGGLTTAIRVSGTSVRSNPLIAIGGQLTLSSRMATRIRIYHGHK